MTEASDSKPASTSTSSSRRMQSQESRNTTETSDKSPSTSSWIEEPTSTNMDISTGHMVLAYMEDHLKNRQRLEQEWVGLCSYEAEPCSTKVAFKVGGQRLNLTLQVIKGHGDRTLPRPKTRKRTGIRTSCPMTTTGSS